MATPISPSLFTSIVPNADFDLAQPPLSIDVPAEQTRVHPDPPNHYNDPAIQGSGVRAPIPQEVQQVIGGPAHFAHPFPPASADVDQDLVRNSQSVQPLERSRQPVSSQYSTQFIRRDQVYQDKPAQSIPSFPPQRVLHEQEHLVPVPSVENNVRSQQEVLNYQIPEVVQGGTDSDITPSEIYLDEFGIPRFATPLPEPPSTEQLLQDFQDFAQDDVRTSQARPPTGPARHSFYKINEDLTHHY